MTNTDYDDIALDYVKSKVIPAKQFGEVHTFFQALNDVSDKSVLDLVCGDGYYTRAIKTRGASAVTGVDISKAMISLAKQEESAQRLGITHLTRDIAKTATIGEFDMEKQNLFTMKYVCKQTGLTPHVIRAWESRYRAVVPKRSPKNRRLYSEDDVQRFDEDRIAERYNRPFV
jgi:SAM-dependent methyltransferase